MTDLGALALALVAGAVAAFNPCGFALLPPYLTLLVADQQAGGPAGVGRALRFASGMSVGFVAVFGSFGLLVAPLSLAVERYLPYLTVVIGIALVVTGGWLVAGRSLPAVRTRPGVAPTTTWRSQVAYGVTFALASLSCTVGPFLAVTSTSLRGASVAGVLASYLLYALGMGTVVLVLALAVTTAHASVVRSMRRVGALVGRLGGLVLVVAGAYVAWYGWFEIRVLADASTDDPVVEAALNIQTALTRLVTSVGATGILLAATAIVAIVVALVLLRPGRWRAGRG